MTIYTGKLLEKDPEKEELKIPDPVVVHGFSPEHENLANHKDEGRPPILLTVMSRQRRRRGACANACLLLTAMVVLAAGILGGIYLYKSLSRRTFEGWCGVTYFEQEELDEMRRQSQLRQTAGAVYSDRGQQFVRRYGKFEEHIEIDKVEGKYERIEVPEFEMSSPATVIHDFDKNLTAIVDDAHMKCFLLPLNRTVITPPQSNWDLLGKLISGYYMPDLEIVRERYSVVQPKIENLGMHGYYIWRQCHQMDTYMLKKIGEHEPVAMVKRDLSAVSGHHCQFAVPGGLHLLPLMKIEGCA